MADRGPDLDRATVLSGPPWHLAACVFSLFLRDCHYLHGRAEGGRSDRYEFVGGGAFQVNKWPIGYYDRGLS